MKFRRGVLALAVPQLLVGAAMAQDAQPSVQPPIQPLTLPAAVARALEISPELRQSEQRRLATEAVRDQVRREVFPRLTLEGAAGVRHLENDARINLGLSNSDDYPLYASIGLDQSLYDFGRRGNELRNQKFRLLAAGQNEQSAGEATAFAVTSAYLRVVLFERAQTAARDNLAFHDKMAADMREGVARGAMSISERQQADERRQVARVRVTEAESDLVNARTEFAALVGAEPQGLTMPPNPAAKLPPTASDLAELVAQTNPKVREAEALYSAAKASAKRARSELKPQLTASGNVRTGEDFDGYRGRTNDFQALATMRWQFFDGGVGLARVREADHRAEEARYGAEQTRRDAERDARDQWQRLSSWRSKADAQEVRANVANDVLLSYRAQFGIGRRSLLDVLDAQGASYNARVEADTARVGALLSEYAILAQTNQLRDFLGMGTGSAGGAADKPVYGPK